MQHQYFEHTECEYYPCFFAGQNCLFCFCPLYTYDCKGNYETLDNGLKDCTKCALPHIKENYLTIVDALAGKEIKWRKK